MFLDTADKEREFASDELSWEIYVGGITPEEFCMGHESIESAVSCYLSKSWQWYEPEPDWLWSSLVIYLKKNHFSPFCWVTTPSDLLRL